MKKEIYFLFIICLITACSSVKQINIETFNPAEITFPGHVSKILLVNNAVPQPSNSGYTYKLYNINQDSCRAYSDSALFDAPRILGKAIADADYFDDVLLYHLPARQDTIFLADGKLSREKVKELCDETGTDAIISFDRLLFDMNKDVVAVPTGYVVGVLKVEIKGIVRAYLPERENPLAMLAINDSMIWEEFATSTEILNNLYLPHPDKALRTTTTYTATNLASNFVPHWNNDIRWYYTGIGARWKEASAYAANQKWDLAAERWNSIYESTSNKKTKAKMASNLALANEMQSEFIKAYDWALRASKLSKEESGSESNDTKLLTLYAQALAARIQSDQKLNFQFDNK